MVIKSARCKLIGLLNPNPTPFTFKPYNNTETGIAQCEGAYTTDKIIIILFSLVFWRLSLLNNYCLDILRGKNKDTLVFEMTPDIIKCPYMKQEKLAKISINTLLCNNFVVMANQAMEQSIEACIYW